MYKPDKATTECNAQILRQLIKQPDDKLCADCQRNDPRWASWNLGVYLCIRCSSIHRGMGTHISRVKPIDLDMWTPEQMEKWGNRHANLYWEAHFKSGHVAPDQYVLTIPTAPLSRGCRTYPRALYPDPGPSPVPAQIPSQPQQQQAANDLFTLDFHAPASAPQALAKDVKQDILSLFSAGTAHPVNAVQGSPWAAQVQVQPSQAQQPISIMGTTGTGMWGVSSGWTGPPASTVTSTTNVWGSSSTSANAFGIVNTNDIWGGSTAQPTPASKKDDVFGDLWGDSR